MSFIGMCSYVAALRNLNQLRKIKMRNQIHPIDEVERTERCNNCGNNNPGTADSYIPGRFLRVDGSSFYCTVCRGMIADDEYPEDKCEDKDFY